MVKRGKAAVTICSSAFVSMGEAQAAKLGAPELPIAVVPHPFGLRTRDEVRAMAQACVGEIVQLVGGKAAP
jgi:hypothetical protein